MATDFLPEDYGFSYAPQLPPRAAIEAAVETLVAVLDAMAGEADAEDDDPLEDTNEDGHSWVERIDQTKHPYAGHEAATCGAHEDAEDDDPGGGNVEDEGEDVDEREPDEGDHCGVYGIDQSRQIGPDNPEPRADAEVETAGRRQ